MRNIAILVVQLCGIAFILVAFLSFLNFMFDLGLGYKGEEVPAEIEFAVFFLALGLIFTPAGWLLSRRFGARTP